MEAERRREIAPEVCCEGAAQGLVHTREIRPTSLFGPVRLRVRTFRCWSCGAHSRPDDEALGVPRSGHFTDDVRELLAPLCAELPDRTAADLLERTTGTSLSPRGVQGVIRSVAADLRREREAQEVLDERVVSVSLARSGGPALGIELSMDGVTAHVDGVWREVKVATLLVREIDEAVAVDADKRRGRVLARRLTSVLGGPEELAQRVLSLIRQAGWDEVPVVEVLGYGAPCIWNLASIHSPGARQTLDWWHLAEHFHVFAKLRFTDKAGAKRWVRGKMGALLADRVGDVLGGLRRMRPRNAAERRSSKVVPKHGVARLALLVVTGAALFCRCSPTPDGSTEPVHPVKAGVHLDAAPPLDLVGQLPVTGPDDARGIELQWAVDSRPAIVASDALRQTGATRVDTEGRFRIRFPFVFDEDMAHLHIWRPLEDGALLWYTAAVIGR